MAESRGNATPSVQNMAGSKKTRRNGQPFTKQSPGQDELESLPNGQTWSTGKH